MKRFLFFAACLSMYTSLVTGQAMSPWSNTGPVIFPSNLSGQVDGIGRVSQIKFHPTDPQKMYAVSASGGLFISTNNGLSWAPTSGTDKLPQTSCSAVCIDYTNDQIMYLSLGDANYYSNNYGIYKSINGGLTWTAANSGIGTSMAVEILMDPVKHQNLVAATSGGIYVSTNSGSSWSLKLAGSFRDMKAKPGSKTNLYAVTGTQFYMSTNFGNSWSQVTNGVTVPSANVGMRIAVSAADAQRVYLATTDGNGTILKSINGGQSFTTVYNSIAQSLIGYDETPYSYSQGDYNLDLNCNPVNADEILLAAHCVWRSIDGGVTWSKRTSWYNEMHTDMHQIEWNPYNNSQLWCANDGGVWMTTDPLATAWHPRSDGLAASEIYHAAQSPKVRDLVSIGTQDNGELYYKNGVWACNRGGDWGARSAFDYGNTGTVWYPGTGYHRNLLPIGSDQPYNCPYNPWSTARIEFLPNMANVAFTGMDNIYRSTNVNTPYPSWQLIKANTEGLQFMATCTADSNILYVVTTGGHLFRSDNALSPAPTFITIATPTSTYYAASIATKRGDANVVFLSCNNALYRSANKGATWTNITGTGLSGLNIRRVIHDDYSTNERLFVNEGSYVHYKNNTTTAWTANTGLPTVANATDFMIYNPGNSTSLLRVSTFGRGVWQCDINANMPPVARLAQVDQNIKTLPQSQFSADDTTVCAGTPVTFTDASANATSWSWSFPGGTPEVATTQQATVVYSKAGQYSVLLTTSNNIGSDVKTRTNYIQVFALPEIFITAAGNVLTANGTGVRYQWFRNGNTIAGATGSTYTASQSDFYTVQILDTNGCVSISPVFTHFSAGAGTATDGNGFQVYPNPSTGIIHITGNNLAVKDVIVSCYNAMGALMHRELAHPVNGSMQASFDWSGMPKGVYQVSIDAGNGNTVHQALVIQ